MLRICIQWLDVNSFVLLLLFSAFFAPGTQQKITRVQSDEVSQHRVNPSAIVHTRMPPGFTSIDALLHVVINASGKVESAKVWNLNDRLDAQWAINQAEAAEEQQQFHPFRRHGHAVRVAFDDQVWIVPPVEWASTRIVFPEILNRSSLRMAIERTGCYGTCPSYSLEVHGDGDVYFEGKDNVPVRGHVHTRVSQGTVDRLLASFRKADYFSLKDEYVALITDNPTCITSLQFDSVQKSVKDYVGFAAGMPEVVRQIERDMDQVAREHGWIR